MKKIIFITTILLIGKTLSIHAQEWLVPYKDEKGNWGYKNNNGVIKTPAIYAKALPSEYHRNAIAQMGKKETIVKGKKIVSPALWGVIDQEGNIILDFKYTIIRRVYEGRFVSQLYTTQKFGLFDHEGKQILPCEYDELYGFNYAAKITCAVKNGKYGFVDINNKEIIPFEYDKVTDTSFAKGYVRVYKNDKEYVLDVNNKPTVVSSNKIANTVPVVTKPTPAYTPPASKYTYNYLLNFVGKYFVENTWGNTEYDYKYVKNIAKYYIL